MEGADVGVILKILRLLNIRVFGCVTRTASLKDEIM